ncbi:hypothetical protein KIPB_008294 [Kipferlia bialata]|uniref:Uncharacterized protein n=1 Tax=Kipferlia bialata TaxID=797122 RepID=A0A9K3D2L1_9EUKA|nr:hypothetical protein KIPB_008294 [Kipferlia bialata]|eukprot:g8294.t1
MMVKQPPNTPNYTRMGGAGRAGTCIEALNARAVCVSTLVCSMGLLVLREIIYLVGTAPEMRGVYMHEDWIWSAYSSSVH